MYVVKDRQYSVYTLLHSRWSLRLNLDLNSDRFSILIQTRWLSIASEFQTGRGMAWDAQCVLYIVQADFVYPPDYVSQENV